MTIKKPFIMIKKIFFISTFILLSISVYSQTDRWYLAGNMATPVADGQLVFYQQNMYMLGGYSDSYQSAINLIQLYNVENNTWSNLGSMVIPRSAFVAVSYNREIFSIGGISGDNINSNNVEVYNFDDPSEIIYSNNYFNRYYSSAALFGSELFVIGGNPENINPLTNSPYIYSFHLKDNIITTIENQMFAYRKLPEQQMVAIFQDEIYIFGGILNGVSRDIYKYDINDSSLVKLNIKLIEPRAGGKAISYADENIIMIIGGYNENNDALSSMEIFRTESNNYRIWTGPELNVARKNFMISQYSDKVYVMGGYDDRGDVLSSIEIFEPELTDIEKKLSLPEQISLHQNYPNPFNPTTEISFSLTEQSKISLDIYSSLGEHIRCLESGDFSPGEHSVTWDSKNHEGKTVPSGIYFYILTTNKREYAKKMVLLK